MNCQCNVINIFVIYFLGSSNGYQLRSKLRVVAEQDQGNDVSEDGEESPEGETQVNCIQTGREHNYARIYDETAGLEDNDEEMTEVDVEKGENDMEEGEGSRNGNFISRLSNFVLLHKKFRDFCFHIPYFVIFRKKIHILFINMTRH